MNATDRLALEQAFHDEQCRRRAASFPADESMRFADDAYLDHETWIRPAFARLGRLDGLRARLRLRARHGGGRDGEARRPRDRVRSVAGLRRGSAAPRRANGTAVDCVAADAERLPFADGSFDRIWGNAVLHHLDLARAVREVRRVLAPGGVAVFCEPWGENPVLTWARRRLHYAGKGHTPDEEPLRLRHLPIFRRVFPRLRVESHQLLSMVRRVVRRGRLTAALEWCDAGLLRLAPALGWFCRYVVLTLPR